MEDTQTKPHLMFTYACIGQKGVMDYCIVLIPYVLMDVFPTPSGG